MHCEYVQLISMFSPCPPAQGQPTVKEQRQDLDAGILISGPTLPIRTMQELNWAMLLTKE